MTSIRNRLLSLLIPPLIIFVVLISLFFYYKWHEEITKSYRATLEAIVRTSGRFIDPEDIVYINENRNDPRIANTSTYKNLLKKLTDIESALPVENIYIVAIEAVSKGEPVLLDKPVGPNNPVYEGKDEKYKYRQVYLLDADPDETQNYDFSESDEHQIYTDKKVLITPVYHGLGTNESFMSGYAPIIDEKGQVVALVGADINLALFESSLHNALVAMIIMGALAVLFVVLSTLFIAYKITEPVQKLKDAALVLASGEYDESIDVSGPKEIVELSNTLNTMRECLLENISRLTNYTLSKEKLYGEYECAELLQTHMLDKPIQDLKNDRLKVKSVSLPSSAFIGLNLQIQSSENQVDFLLEEAIEEDFEGIFRLLSSGTTKFVKTSINFETEKVSYETRDMPPPFIWSTKLYRFVPPEEYTIENGDFIVIINTGLVKQMPYPQLLKDWLSKVFKHFAKEGFELTGAMLQSELNFLARKHINHEDIHILLISLIENQATHKFKTTE